jgi:hypothetical protein
MASSSLKEADIFQKSMVLTYDLIVGTTSPITDIVELAIPL